MRDTVPGPTAAAMLHSMSEVCLPAGERAAGRSKGCRICLWAFKSNPAEGGKFIMVINDCTSPQCLVTTGDIGRVRWEAVKPRT